MKKDSLGDRIKSQYEHRTRYFLPRRTYVVIRVDGKAFHTFTRGCNRPFDNQLITSMDEVAIALCNQIDGAAFAYAQSDEVSVLVTDFSREGTGAWFDNNLQKMSSVSASIATAAFNCSWAALSSTPDTQALALFDSRVFTIPDPVEVENYFIWRQKDWTRNSIQLVGQSFFSHRELHGKNNSKIQEMLFTQKGVNWSDYPAHLKRGRIIKYNKREEGSLRRDSRWVVDNDIPVFTRDRSYLRNLIPSYGYGEREEGKCLIP